MNCFGVFIIVLVIFSYCYFLIVHLHCDYYYYMSIHNVRTFSSDTESEALAVTRQACQLIANMRSIAYVSAYLPIMSISLIFPHISCS